MDHMKTQSQVITELQGQGYELNLRIGEDGRITGEGREWSVGDVTVDRVFRFEGMSSADDLSMLMAVSVPGGDRGLVSLPYGPSASGDQADTIRALTMARPGDDA